MEWNFQEALAHYKSIGAPADQQALIALLREVQTENGGALTRADLGRIAEDYKIKEAILVEGRYDKNTLSGSPVCGSVIPTFWSCAPGPTAANAPH